jgi:hypothetical protein
MKPTTATVLALAALSLLAACGPKAGGNAAAAGGAPGAGGAPSASGPDVQINLSDLPHPRGGLWQNTIDDGDGKPAVTTSCLSGRMPTMPKMPAGCSQLSIKRTFLGHIVMDMNCATPDFTMVMHSEATGDFQNNMSSDATMTMSSKQMPAKTTKMHTEAHYLGPCAPGQTPDDAPDSNAAG